METLSPLPFDCRLDESLVLVANLKLFAHFQVRLQIEGFDLPIVARFRRQAYVYKRDLAQNLADL